MFNNKKVLIICLTAGILLVGGCGKNAVVNSVSSQKEEIEEITVTEEFEIETGETESVGGF